MGSDDAIVDDVVEETAELETGLGNAAGTGETGAQVHAFAGGVPLGDARYQHVRATAAALVDKAFEHPRTQPVPQYVVGQIHCQLPGQIIYGVGLPVMGVGIADDTARAFGHKKRETVAESETPDFSLHVGGCQLCVREDYIAPRHIMVKYSGHAGGIDGMAAPYCKIRFHIVMMLQSYKDSDKNIYGPPINGDAHRYYK